MVPSRRKEFWREQGQLYHRDDGAILELLQTPVCLILVAINTFVIFIPADNSQPFLHSSLENHWYCFSLLGTNPWAIKRGFKFLTPGIGYSSSYPFTLPLLNGHLIFVSFFGGGWSDVCICLCKNANFDISLCSSTQTGWAQPQLSNLQWIPRGVLDSAFNPSYFSRVWKFGYQIMSRNEEKSI